MSEQILILVMSTEFSSKYAINVADNLLSICYYRLNVRAPKVIPALGQVLLAGKFLNFVHLFWQYIKLS